MTDIDIRERLTKVEERAKSNTHQISELKPVMNEIHAMSKTMIKLVEQSASTNKSLNELKNKVDSLEKEPVERLRQIKTAIITALTTAIISGLVGAVIYFN